MLDIINDILDISRIESGQLPVNMTATNLEELFSELSSFFNEYQKRLNKVHIELNLRAFSNHEQNLILTDKVKLKQIFINLISNAFKFTDNGKIEGTCKLDNANNLIFSVSDTGIGLGLSIVKALVSLLG